MRRLKTTALCLLAAAALLPARALPARAQSPRPIETRHRLFIPWTNEAFDVELRGLVMNLLDISDEVRAKAAAAGLAEPRVREYAAMLGGKEVVSKFGLLLIRLEPLPAGVGAEAWRASAAEFYAKSKHVSKADIKLAAYGQTPLLKYKFNVGSPMVGAYFGYLGGTSAFPVPFLGLPGSVRVLEAFVVREGTAITFRFTSPEIKEKDEQFFYSVLDTVKFFDASSPSSSYDYLMLGRDLYNRKEHGRAVAALDKGLALERRKRELTQTQWRDLVMTLANALGGADRAELARDVLEYGVAEEPTFPYFHHGLSRLHAYFGDLDRTLAELEKTYQNMPKGPKTFVVGIPDPSEDPAYRKFAGDQRFSEGVKTLKKKYKN